MGWSTEHADDGCSAHLAVFHRVAILHDEVHELSSLGCLRAKQPELCTLLSWTAFSTAAGWERICVLAGGVLQTSSQLEADG